ncbi:MAG: OmpP1/FadL family transporter [Polyangiaceae bacterium]|jgi:long-chain fatty acid transport protein
MRTFRRSVVGASVLLFVAVACTRDADAAGFASARFGGELGNPVTTNPTALYYNPAGIAFSQGIDLFGDADLAIRHATWSHQAPAPGASDQPESQVGNSGNASLLNVFGGPAVGATIKLGDLAIGAGLFVPFGGRVNWGQNSQFQSSYPAGQTCAANGACPLAADGVQRWHIIDAALTFIYITAGAAYKLGPLAIGVTGNFIDSTLVSTQARTLGGEVDSTVENRGTINVGGLSGSFAAGAMLEAVPDRLWLGASYQSQPGLGPQILKGTVTETSGQAPYYSDTGTTSYKVDFHQSLPDIIRAGVRFRASDVVEIRVFGDLTRWSVMKSQCVNLADTSTGTACYVYPNGAAAPAPGSSTPSNIFTNIPRNWKDTYGIRVGASYWVKPEIELFGGLGYETAAVPDSTLEPGAMDADNIGIALGARLRITKTLYLAGSYTQLQYLNRDNTGKSTLAVNNLGPVQQPTYQEDGGGKYTQWIGIFDGNIEAKF